ncbi:MAG: hypothetical protein WCO56_25355 [Verrucomicrobiota bacterium]
MVKMAVKSGFTQADFIIRLRPELRTALAMYAHPAHDEKPLVIGLITGQLVVSTGPMPAKTNSNPPLAAHE